MSQNRAAFGYGHAEQVKRDWGTSFLVSTGLYVGIALLVATIGARKIVKVAEKAVELTFTERIVKEEPPPPPPPPVAKVEPPKAPAAAAPVVRPDMKVRRLDKPPPPKQLVAPNQMPQAAPKEANPEEDKGVAVYGEGGKGDAAGLEGGVTKGGVVGGEVGGAIALPEDADPPMPEEGNAVPQYPQEARASGRTGTVVLKVVILADGTVGKVEVMRGDEPFVSAAVTAVKKWKYEPARYQGQAITVYRIIQIPFKLTA